MFTHEDIWTHTLSHTHTVANTVAREKENVDFAEFSKWEA